MNKGFRLERLPVPLVDSGTQSEGRDPPSTREELRLSDARAAFLAEVAKSRYWKCRHGITKPLEWRERELARGYGQHGCVQEPEPVSPVPVVEPFAPLPDSPSGFTRARRASSREEGVSSTVVGSAATSPGPLEIDIGGEQEEPATSSTLPETESRPENEELPETE